MDLYRYSRWDGTQEPFPLDAGQVLDHLAPDLMAHGDIHRALRDLFRRGLRGSQGGPIRGLRDLLEEARRRRQEVLQRYNLDSVLEDIRRRLEEVVRTEREGIARRREEVRRRIEEEGGDPATDPRMRALDRQAERALSFLEGLPPSVAGRVQALSRYEFLDPTARQKFQELLDLLRRRFLQQYFRSLRDALRSLGPEDLAGLREMLRELNRLLRQRARGEEPDYEGFLRRFGHLFGPQPPETLDDLLEHLARQVARVQSLLDSLSPEQRRELESLVESLLDPETRMELEELAFHLDQAVGLEALRREYRFLGEEPLDLEQAMQVMEGLQRMEELEENLREVMRRGDLESLDLDRLEEVLGPSAREEVERLRRLARLLEEAGYLRRHGDRLELTPKAVRRLGQRALQEVFRDLTLGRTGDHPADRPGVYQEPTGGTRPFRLGDPLDLALDRTLLNAVVRRGPGTPVRLEVGDFEVVERESVTSAATVLLLDQSRSMGLFGSFEAAKRVALALCALIRTRFPRDVLYIVGFSDYAVEIPEEELPRVTWNAWVSGTNMQHALMVARRLLSRHKGATRQVLLVTDGEPTAHLEGMRAYFSYPPSYETIEKTLQEAMRCTREGITINTFMLETTPYLLDFVDRLTRINRGRAFYTTPDRLGEYILVDYIRNRRRSRRLV